eukprot:scaffold145316_cov20-Tisochrysis_lutea.AAC.3
MEDAACVQALSLYDEEPVRLSSYAQVYRILMKYTSCVQALSCDEAYLDVTGLGDPEELAAAIRAEIHATTQCTASADPQECG